MKTIKQLMDLSGRKALITGGTGHIGSTCCDTLRELGARVAVLDLEPTGELSFPCDLRDETSTRRSVQEAVKKMNGLDILIHCAAYVGTTKVPGWTVPFEEQKVSAWDEALRVNLTSAFVLTQESQKALEQSGHGSIILFSSIYGIVGPDMRLYAETDMANPAGYNVSKGGILQLTRYLASVFAPKIRVNAISPGGVWRDQPKVFQKRYVERTPLNRMATEEDMKGAVAFLTSNLSQYVTGQNIVVDGGWTAW